MIDFDFSKFSYDFYRYDNGTYCARFSYPDDNGGFLSVNFEFVDSYYRDHSDSISFIRVDTFLPFVFELKFMKFKDSLYVVDLPTIFGYRSKRFKWLRSGTHHTRLIIDFKKLFAF